MRFIRASEMTIPSATGSAPPESPVPAPRATNGMPSRLQSFDDRLHLGGRRGQRDELGNDPPAGQAVALVRPQLLRLADDGDGGGELLDERRLHRRQSAAATAERGRATP